MAEYKAYTVRLDPLIGDEYEKTARELGLKPAEYLREILTNNLHLINLKSEVGKVEYLLKEFEENLKKSMVKFKSENALNEKYFEDFGAVYMMMLSFILNQNVDQQQVRNIQKTGLNYAHENYISSEKST